MASQASHHGRPLRGLAHNPASRSFEGRFGRLFRELAPASFQPELLQALAQTMLREVRDEPPSDQPDAEDNAAIPAGYTYFGQFVDHDLTFDPVSSLDRLNDPNALTDYRTPRFDLDSLYGRGPADQPYLYDDAGRFMLGSVVDANPQFAGPDLPRAANQRALIGDPRNDENKILSQLHSVFLRFHNRILADQGGNFDLAQREVRWTYQWLVLNDYLPRIVGRPLVDAILTYSRYVVGTDRTGAPIFAQQLTPDLRYYRPRREAFMPVEFSGAAFRFGHSMVRPSYFLNDALRTRLDQRRIPVFVNDRAAEPGPNSSTRDLSSFAALPPGWGVQWKYFFDVGEGREWLQPSLRIDEKISAGLGQLPRSVARQGPLSLPQRNLNQGVLLRLPTGQDLARALGLRPLDDKDLLGDLPPEIAKQLMGATPLWFYLLRESAVVSGGARLGPVGARIVAEVIIGILWHDPQSFLRSDPSFLPAVNTVGDLIRAL